MLDKNSSGKSIEFYMLEQNMKLLHEHVDRIHELEGELKTAKEKIKEQGGLSLISYKIPENREGKTKSEKLISIVKDEIVVLFGRCYIAWDNGVTGDIIKIYMDIGNISTVKKAPECIYGGQNLYYDKYNKFATGRHYTFTNKEWSKNKNIFLGVACRDAIPKSTNVIDYIFLTEGSNGGIA